MLSDCKDLSSYLAAYGPVLGVRATKALSPLHDPEREGVHPSIATLKRAPFNRQAHLVTAIAKAWRRQKTCWLIGECGVGKTLCGVAAIHAHANGKPYRALILCPDHLLKKWKEEIEITCPGATVKIFDDWSDVLAYTQAGKRIEKRVVPGPVSTTESEIASVSTDIGPHVIGFGDWQVNVEMPYQFEDRPVVKPTGTIEKLVAVANEPAGPEWLILGRDLSKGDPAWEQRFMIKRIPLGEGKFAALRKKGATLDEITTQVAKCPRCGNIVKDKEGAPIAISELKLKRLKCQGMIVRYRQKGEEVVRVEKACNEPLWQYVAATTKAARATRKAKLIAADRKASAAPFRWAPYRSLHANMKRRIDYLILDEVHELGGNESVGRANAAGALAATAKKVLAMTGTLINGYADNLFPIMMRLAPQSLLKMGIGWSNFKKFNEKYGRIQTTYHTRGRGGDDYDGGEDNSHSKGSSSKVTKARKPGIMPQLFGEHLIDKCVFLTLEDVAADASKAGLLPALFEEVVPVDMDPELEESYGELQTTYASVIKEMMKAGNKTALGSMLTDLIGYPDMPYGWPERYFEWSSWGDKSSISIQSETLDWMVTRNKDQALLDICLREQSQGRKTWIYLQMTDIRDYGARLQKILGDAGLRVGYMRSAKPKRTERAEWIYKNAPKYDVILSHPKLVETGLDLFAKDGNHNFPTLVFGQLGWQLFTTRQAGRRSWRIGQTLPCRTIFVYYKGTLQQHNIEHMGKKLVAAEAIEGKFSAEGLVAMAGEDDETIALAKALITQIDMPASNWSRSLGFTPTGEPTPAPVFVPTPVAEPVGPRLAGTVSFSEAELASLRALMATLGVTA